MWAYRGHSGRRERWSPDLVAEPVTRDVAVGIANPGRARVIHPGHPALPPVMGEGIPALLTPAAPSRVGAEGAVPVDAASGVGFGAAETGRVGQRPQRRTTLRHGEYQ